MISRRELIELALAGPVLANVQPAAAQSKLDRRTVMAAQGAVVAADGCRPQSVDLIREWSAGLCQSRIVNRGKEPVRLKEVLLFDLPMALPPETHLYGEGFQMLSQTGGTLAKPEDYSQYTGRGSSRRPGRISAATGRTDDCGGTIPTPLC
jgi:alpha-galactosidase